jgi:hypothetical protein
VKEKRKKESGKAALGVAVVVGSNCALLPVASSLRPHGDWACFVGDRGLVIERALKARADWSRGNCGPYRILVGTLTEEVRTPTNYKVERLVTR